MKKLAALLLLLAALPLPAFQAPAARPAPKPTPGPTPPALEGVVKGSDGRPIQGALVIARSSVDFAEPPLSTNTDASGRFRLTVRRAAPYTVRVEARGLAGRTIEKARPGAPIEAVLSRGAVLEGTVRDGVTGQLVAQAQVEAREESALSLPWDTTAGIAQTLSDAKGRFRLEGLGSGPQTVWARTKGYGSGPKMGALPGRPIDLYLFPGSTLTGTVWGPSNVPVAGAVVRAEAEAPNWTMSPAVSDARGRYEIAGLDAGHYGVVARHKDFAPGLVADLDVERGSDAQADVVLDKGAAVLGRLVAGPQPQAVAGRVSVQEIDGRPTPRPLRDVLRAEAGLDGRFRMEAVPAGAHVLAVTAPGYAPKRVEAQVAPSGRSVDVGDVELETGLTIRGRVRERAGAPVAGANVAAYPMRGMGPETHQAVSEVDGSFVLAGVEPGSYRVNASAPGYAGMDRLVDSGADKVELILSPAGGIAGVVLDDAGRPIETFRISARPTRREPMTAGPIVNFARTRMVTSTDGRFLLEDVGEGTYVVEAAATGRSTGNVSDVKVTVGSTTDVGTIRLSAGGTIRGTVTDAAATPVPGATISVRGAGRDFMGPGMGPQGVTDPAGAFEVTGVAPGPMEVRASHPNFADGRVSGIEVDPAKGVAEARIVLTQGGRIEGWARRRDGSAIAGVYVSIVIQAPGRSMTSGPGMLVTNSAGGFVAEHVPAGRVTVTLMTRSGSSYASAQGTEVDVREGETTPVELRSREILVSGRVTRAGAALPGVRITLHGNHTMVMGMGPPEVPPPPAAPQQMTAVSGEDGGYEMIVDQPGRASVQVDSVDGRTSYPTRTIEVPDADAYILDLAFGGATITGVVVDQETEQPVPRAHVFALPKKPGPGSTGGSGGDAGEDGRFHLEVELGDYKVRASAENYGPAVTEVSVGSSPGSDVRLALNRGLTLEGKVVAVGGRGVGGLQVRAMSLESGPNSSGGGAMTLPDGTFQMGGLRPVPHRVFARSEIGAFALRTGVTPGDKEVVLTLRPGGRLTIRVLGPDGQPVAQASALVEDLMLGTRTDAQGTAELMVPAGTLSLRARKDQLGGRTTVTVAEGGTAVVEVKLAADPAGGTP
jgi:protocatechuate 3,4-dioxygenase beta subunit